MSQASISADGPSSGDNASDMARFLWECRLGQSDEPVSLVFVVSPSHKDNAAFISHLVGPVEIQRTLGDVALARRVYMFGPIPLNRITSKWVGGGKLEKDANVIFASKVVPETDLLESVPRTDEVTFLGLPFLIMSQICIWIHSLDVDGVASFLVLVRKILNATNSKHKERAGFAFVDILINDSLFSKMCHEALKLSRDKSHFVFDPNLYQELTEMTRNEYGDITQISEPENRKSEHRWIMPQFPSVMDPVTDLQLALEPVAILLLDILHNIQNQRVASGKDVLNALEIFQGSAVTRLNFERMVLESREISLWHQLELNCSSIVQLSKRKLEKYFVLLQAQKSSLQTPTEEELRADKLVLDLIDKIRDYTTEGLFLHSPKNRERYEQMIAAARKAIFCEAQQQRSQHLKSLRHRQKQYISRELDLFYVPYHAFPSICVTSIDEYHNKYIRLMRENGLSILNSLKEALRLPESVVKIGIDKIDMHVKLLAMRAV